MALVDVKKKEDTSGAPNVQPAEAPQSDLLRDALKDPLEGERPEEKPRSQAFADQKQSRDEPAEAAIIPAEEPDESIVVVSQAEERVVVAVDASGRAEVMSETSPDAVKPEKIEKAVQEAVEPSPPTVDQAEKPTEREKGVAARVPV